MIFDRRPFYLIGCAAALVIAALFYFVGPRVTAEQRVQEQLAIVARQPWVRVRVADVHYMGTGEPDQVLVRAVRVDDGSPVVIDFSSKGPYTSATTLRRLTDQSLAGQVVEVKMVPLPLAEEPFRSAYRAGASHVGVALFASLPGQATATTSPAAATGSTPSAPAATDG